MQEIINLIKRLDDTLNEAQLIDDGEECDYFIMQQEDCGKCYCFLSLEGSLQSEEVLKRIEDICISNPFLKKIAPQFIYFILLLRVDKATAPELLYTRVIAIEEDEYFCKKYVLYYTDDEVKYLNGWINEQENKELTQIVNNPTNIGLMQFEQTNDKNVIAFKFLLRILIKCPFIKIEFEKKGLDDFDALLIDKIGNMRKSDESKAIIEYKNKIFDKIDVDNMNEFADQYLKFFKSEGNVDGDKN